MLSNSSKLLSIIYHPIAQVICWGVFAFSLIYKLYIPYVHYELMAVIYIVLILNVTSNVLTLIRLENRLLDWTGKISYGLYMYHWPLIVILLFYSKKYPSLFSFLTSNYLLPLVMLSYIATYIVASLSFRYFERPILALKTKATRTPKPLVSALAPLNNLTS